MWRSKPVGLREPAAVGSSRQYQLHCEMQVQDGGLLPA
jgi:hypothetical protein